MNLVGYSKNIRFLKNKRRLPLEVKRFKNHSIRFSKFLSIFIPAFVKMNKHFFDSFFYQTY